MGAGSRDKGRTAVATKDAKPSARPSNNRIRELRRDVARIERELVEAEAQVAELTRRLAEPDAFADSDQGRELAERFGKAKDRSAALMEQWTEASMAVEAASER
ncbi:MAG: ABC transporter C-terminal domain-containing protein [Microthrixaceae bacterium]